MIYYILNYSFEFIEVDDGYVALDENVQTIFHFDKVGAIILDELKLKKTKEELIEKLNAHFDNIIMSELDEFLLLLEQKGMLAIETCQDK